MLALGIALIAGGAVGGEVGGYEWSVFEIRGDAPNYLDIGVGAYNLFDEGGVADRRSDDTSALGRVEVRFGRKVLGIGPAIGLMANTDGGAHG